MARILFFGPERQRAREVHPLLRHAGHDVVSVRDLRDWPTLERELHPHLVVAATPSPAEVLQAPGRGASFARGARGFPPPLLFVHQEADVADEANLEDRLVDRIVSPFLSEELLARVGALADVHRLLHGEPIPDASARPGGWKGLWRRANRTPPAGPPQVVARVEVIDRLAAWSDGRDTFPPGHSDRVGALCRLMAEGLGLDEAEATVLARAASLHDIGKIALPVEVLHHDGPLGEVETRAIRTHPRRGAALVRLLDPDEAVCRTVLCHHERPDGSGYLGFQGEKVPRTASILAVAECVDAMTSTTLSVRHSSGEAVGMLRSQEAGVYDADCVEALADRLKPRPDVIPLSAPFVPSG